MECTATYGDARALVSCFFVARCDAARFLSAFLARSDSDVASGVPRGVAATSLATPPRTTPTTRATRQVDYRGGRCPMRASRSKLLCLSRGCFGGAGRPVMGHSVEGKLL